MTRRDFIADGVTAVGGAMGLAMLGSFLTPARFAHASKGGVPEPSCGNGGKSNERVLVAYASMSGSTGGVAQAIGETLCGAGAAVDIRLVDTVRDVSAYDAVVMGSAIRGERWLPTARKFVETNREVLSRKPVAYFLTCLTLCNPAAEARRKAETFLDPLIQEVPEVLPVAKGLFAGVLDYGKLSFMMRMVMKQKMKERGISEGDYRNWDAIRSWAAGLDVPLLGAEPKGSRPAQ